jgi:nucleotide-binding universal stress UspA family protein
VFKTILVALDDSTLSDGVAKALNQLKLSADNHVILTHVITAIGQETDAVQPRAIMDSDVQQAEQHLKTYQAALPCPSTVELLQGDPVDEIIRLARIAQADLIVLGSRGLTGLDRILQGSVSSQVLEEAPCSVLVVKLPQSGVSSGEAL